MKRTRIAAVVLLLTILVGMTACGTLASPNTAAQLLATYRWEASLSSTTTLYLFPNGKYEWLGSGGSSGNYEVSGNTIIMHEEDSEYTYSCTITQFDKYTIRIIVEDVVDFEIVFHNMDFIP